MLVAITGTPGTGKTSVSNEIRKKGFNVIDLNNIACEKDFIIKKDKIRNSYIVDTNKLNKFIKKNFLSDKIIFIEGHLSHLLNCIDKVILLRCHPEKLENNLQKKGWSKNKIKENIEAEILDIILCETIEIHSKKNIFEIDTSDKSLIEVAKIILNLTKNKFKNNKNYKIGYINWSEEILKDF